MVGCLVEEGLNFKWIAIGFVCMIVLAIAGFAYMFIVSGMGIETMEMKVVLIWLDSFFIGGVVIGKMSPGKTIMEPAIAAILALLALFLAVDISIFQINAIIILIHAFIFALIGGYIGERWQGTI
ncbi:MAG: hypothetical protein ACE5J5_03855 [Candidatus Hydrothermarchaeales archaeon]